MNAMRREIEAIRDDLMSCAAVVAVASPFVLAFSAIVALFI